MFGRPEAAAAATLHIVTAGPTDLLDRVEPILSVLGRTWRMGEDPRSAYLTKIAGNFTIACAVESIAEAIADRIAGQRSSRVHYDDDDTLFPAPIYRSYGAAVVNGASGRTIGPAPCTPGF